MNGKDFIALRRLTTAMGSVLAEVGDTCERVSPKSLPLLYASGRIQPVVTSVPERAAVVHRLGGGRRKR